MTRTARWLALGVLALAALAVVPFVGCKVNTSVPPTGSPDGVKVAVTFPALYSLAANVVGVLQRFGHIGDALHMDKTVETGELKSGVRFIDHGPGGRGDAAP